MKKTKIENKVASTPMSAEDRKKIADLMHRLFEDAETKVVQIVNGAVDDSRARATLDRISELLDISQSAGNRPLGAEDAAKYLGVSKSFLYHLTSTNSVGFFRSQGGGRLSFAKADLDKWRQARYVPSREEDR